MMGGGGAITVALVVGIACGLVLALFAGMAAYFGRACSSLYLLAAIVVLALCVVAGAASS